jgi:hypothetical protein
VAISSSRSAQETGRSGGFHRQQQAPQNVGSSIIALALAEPKRLAHRRPGVIPVTGAPTLHGIERPQPRIVLGKAARLAQ